MQIFLNAIPETFPEWKALAAEMREPEEICALFLCALALFDRDADSGAKALDRLRGPRPMTAYDRQSLRDRLRGKPYLPYAYFDGATPENGYRPGSPCSLDVTAAPVSREAGFRRFFLRTAGADAPRPMTLRRKASTGEWFLWEYSSILTGIRLPGADDPWA